MSRLTLSAIACALLLTGCTLGPDYQAPALDLGQHYKQVAGWKPTEPDGIDHQPWWQLYQDPVLNTLAEQLDESPDLQIAEARFRQAAALVQTSRAGLYPQLVGGLGAERSGQGAGNVTTSYNLGGSAAWEVDLWGRLRRSLEASEASAQASQADLAAVRLSFENALVQNYLQLRFLDAQRVLLEQTLRAYQRALTLTQNQYAAGMVPKSDVSQALTQFKNTESELLALTWQRGQYENAIAVLVGQTPASLELQASPQLPRLPNIPVSVPSHLLERRPDIAASERRVAAANAQIGIAHSAWFPDLTLSASAGYRGASFADWVNLPNRFWSLGPDFALSLFDGGRRNAELERVQAQYDETVAQYRQSVLSALAEVEDALIQANVLAEQRVVQQQALEAARESLRSIDNQYRAGMIDYNAVVGVQTQALNTERTALNLKLQELLTHTQLIAALGGGWSRTGPQARFVDSAQ